MDPSTLSTIVTAVAGAFIAYLLQKPHVRAVKMFSGGAVEPTAYKLKNAGAATAVCVILADRGGHVIDLDLQLGQDVKYVDALPVGAEVRIGVPTARQPMRLYYENIFGLLYWAELTDDGPRFRMTARKTWPFMHVIPPDVRRELPQHWWRNWWRRRVS